MGCISKEAKGHGEAVLTSEFRCSSHDADIAILCGLASVNESIVRKIRTYQEEDYVHKS